MMYLPAWFRSESGLLVPSSLGPPMMPTAKVPRGLLGEPKPIAVGKPPPTFMDQVAVYADEEAAGLPISSLDAVQHLASTIPFEAGMAMVAAIAAKVFALRGDQPGQLTLAQELVGEGPVLEALRVWMKREGPKAQLFAEQHTLMLERILVEHAKPGLVTAGLTPPEPANVVRALFGCTSIAFAAGEEMSRDARLPEDLLAIFLQNGAYNSKAMPMGEIARAQELFVTIAHAPDLLPAQDKVCPLDEWMLEDYGFSVTEQLSIGFGLAAMTQAWAEGTDAGNVVYVSPENLEDMLLKFDMLDRRQAVLDLVSAERRTLAEEFAGSGKTESHIAWETRPLMRHPFLRRENGGLILLTPRAIESWLSDGFHYRLLDSAQRRSVDDPHRKLSRRYTAYAGQLLEAYALALCRSVHAEDAPVGGGRVYGEQPYGTNKEKKTADIAVDLGLDLVLIEVSASRLRADTLLLAQRDEAMEDIDRMIIAKIDQLDKCITGLRSRRRKDRARIPAEGAEVDMNRVNRIWPVIVTAGNLTQSEPLWRCIAAHTQGKLAQAGVRPLTILDIEDFEALCGIVEEGHALNDLLAGKTQPAYRHLELAVWLARDPRAPKDITGRPKYVEAVWERAVEQIMAATDFTKGIVASSSEPLRSEPSTPSSERA